MTADLPPAPPGDGRQRLVAWAVTAAVIVAGGLALVLSRPALAPWLEAWPDLTALGSTEEEVVEEAPVEEEAEPVAEEPAGPQLTYAEVETMLAPLPARVLELVAEGREELKSFRDLTSRDEIQASRSRRLFGNWGNTWNNRIGLLERDTPPGEECEAHEVLQPTCAMLADVYALLRTVPSVSSRNEGTEVLDRAQLVVEEFLNPPEVEGEETTDVASPGSP